MTDQLTNHTIQTNPSKSPIIITNINSTNNNENPLNFQTISQSSPHNPKNPHIHKKRKIKTKAERYLGISESSDEEKEQKRENLSITDLYTNYKISITTAVNYNISVNKSRESISKHFLKRKIKAAFEREPLEKNKGFFNVPFVPTLSMFGQGVSPAMQGPNQPATGRERGNAHRIGVGRGNHITHGNHGNNVVSGNNMHGGNFNAPTNKNVSNPGFESNTPGEAGNTIGGNAFNNSASSGKNVSEGIRLGSHSHQYMKDKKMNVNGEKKPERRGGDRRSAARRERIEREKREREMNEKRELGLMYGGNDLKNDNDKNSKIDDESKNSTIKDDKDEYMRDYRGKLIILSYFI